jgi:hypothetical protein
VDILKICRSNRLSEVSPKVKLEIADSQGLPKADLFETWIDFIDSQPPECKECGTINEINSTLVAFVDILLDDVASLRGNEENLAKEVDEYKTKYDRLRKLVLEYGLRLVDEGRDIN